MIVDTVDEFVAVHRDSRRYPRPFVLGLMGNFSGEPETPLPSLAERVFIDLEWARTDRLMARLRPRTVVQLDNVLEDARALAVDLRFERMADFEPASLIGRVPELEQLVLNSPARGQTDSRLNALLNQILHAPAFQQLEATWRGLHHLLTRLPSAPHVRVRLFDVTQLELWKSLRRFKGATWDQSPVFKRIYIDEYGTFGGQPFTMLVGDYSFSHEAKDIELLGELSLTMAAAHTVFLAGVSPALFGVRTFHEAGDLREPSRLFRSAEYRAWRELCIRDESACLGLALPRVLMRLPHDVTLESCGLRFTERIHDASDLLWGNPAWFVGADLFAAFAAHRCYARIPQIPLGGLISRLPACASRLVEEDFTDRLRGELESLGLITLRRFRDTTRIAYSPPYGLAAASYAPEFKNTTYMPWRLIVARTIHGLKSLLRIMQGWVSTARDARSVIDAWLRYEVGPGSDLRDRIRLPLRAVEFEVEQVDNGLPECADAVWSVAAKCTPHPFGSEAVR